MKETALFLAAIAVASLMIALDLTPLAQAQEAPQTLPPRYVQEVALYDDQGRLVNILMGEEMYLSLLTCKREIMASVEKPTVQGKKAIGLCVPIPTLSAVDLQDPEGI